MGQFERQKIRAEIAKLNEDLLKTRVDRQKAEKDLENQSILFRLEILRTIGAVGTFFVAAAAVVTLGWNVYTFGLESDRKANEHISSLLRDLDKAPPVRAAAVVSLMPHVHDIRVGPSIILALAHMIGVEDEFEVQSAIVRTLQAAERKGVPVIESVRARMISNLEPLFSDLRKWDDRYANNTAIPNVIHEKRQNLEQQIKRGQRGLVVIAIALRDLTCSQATGNVCVADLSGFPLKQMDLVGARGFLARSRFHETVLWGADLFAVDLTGADFTEAWLNEADLRQAKLVDALFINAHVERVVNRPGSGHLARFEKADLKGAKFSGACLSGADFRGAVHLDIAQFKDAFADGAVFDPEFGARLKAAGFYRSDEKCKEF